MPPEDRKKGFALWPADSKFLIRMENADYFAFADNPRSGLFPAEARPEAMRIVKELTRLFCDWKLKGSEEARTAFTEKHARELLGGKVTALEWLER